jgi:hypothetical protein
MVPLAAMERVVRPRERFSTLAYVLQSSARLAQNPGLGQKKAGSEAGPAFRGTADQYATPDLEKADQAPFFEQNRWHGPAS